MTTDFRAVYSSVISEWLGGDPARGDPRRGVLPRGAADRVSRARASPRRSSSLALVMAASAVAAPRLHRTKLPPPLPLPTSLAVDEGEWLVVPSKRVVAAGDGDAARLQPRRGRPRPGRCVDATGAVRQTCSAPGGTGTLRVTLTPGVWKLYCSLFAGTPDSHEDRGMVAVMRAKADPPGASRQGVGADG